MQDLFTDTMEQLLSIHCSPKAIRQIECGEGADSLWEALEESGFMDALVCEECGGAGLSLNESFPIIFSSGRHALPLPIGQTVLVRGVFAQASIPHPDGPIAIAGAVKASDTGTVHCTNVPFGRVCDWVLVDDGKAAALMPVAEATVAPSGGNGCLDANIQWSVRPANTISAPPNYDWRSISAGVTAALLAGALERVFEMTLSFANDRVQFGKPIGKMQAIQQQLSVMAEQVFAAKMAAQMGFASGTIIPSSLGASLAKSRTSEAVVGVAAIGHAVHGAMGFTEEYDLQLYTRRLHEWRMAYGSESYWNHIIGAKALAADHTRALDFVRQSFPTT